MARKGFRRLLQRTPELKVVFSFLQIVSVLGEVYEVTYPPAFQGIVIGLQAVTLKITSILPVLPLRCISGDLRKQLLFVLLAPLGVIALAAVIGAMLAWQKTRSGIHPVRHASVLRGRAISFQLNEITNVHKQPSHGLKGLLLPSLPFIVVWSFIVFLPASSLGYI